MGDPNKTGSRERVSVAEWAASTAKNPDDFDEPGEPMTEKQAGSKEQISVTEWAASTAKNPDDFDEPGI
jgi:hypothetical protein